MQYWMLPEDVIELLPENAQKVEAIRRAVLDEMKSWGYQYVIPPLVEFLDSLLAGSGKDLDVQTFKITDQASGRMMGVRADFTPQITRIDSHRLPTEGVSRFAYCGDVLRTKSESIEPRRNPLIIGAELYGVEKISADIEIISLLISLLKNLKLNDFILDIGHSGIYAGLVELHHLSKEQQQILSDAMMGNKRPDLRRWKEIDFFSKDCLEDIQFIVNTPLSDNSISEFEQRFTGRNEQLMKAIDDIKILIKKMQMFFPEIQINTDLTNVGSYGYHTGALFAIYVKGLYTAVARGGRYNGVGAVYGKARAATGFSIDLLTLSELQSKSVASTKAVSVAMSDTQEDFLNIAEARKKGNIICFDHEE